MVTLANYLAAVPAGRRERLDAIRELILRLYPDAEETMDYRMPTFRWCDGWMAVANQKQYISVYTCSPAHLELFKEKHPDIKTGKGCINFRDRDVIPLDDLSGVVHNAMEFRH